MKDISVIIINYNTKALCEDAIVAIIKTTRIVDYEIIVVDNSSNPDEHYESRDSSVIVISGVKNLGFGHACNIGANKAQGKYMLFLNSDTVLHDGALDKSIAFLENHKNIGALGIRTLLSDGTVDHNSKRGFPTPINSLFYFMKLNQLFPHSKLFGGYRMTYLPDDETNEVDAISGSFLITPKLVFETLSGFDESFFMYAEDIDLCYRIKEQGYAVVYFADASMLHLKGQSGLNTKSKEVLAYFYESMTLFYDKHYKQKYNFFVTLLVHSAIKAKYMLAARKLGESRR